MPKDPPEKKTPEYVNINIVDAPLGGAYNVFYDDKKERAFGGSIVEKNFAIIFPQDAARKVKLEIKFSSDGKTKEIEKEYDLTKEREDIELIIESPGAEEELGLKLTNKLQEEVQERKQEGAQATTDIPKKKFLFNRLGELIQGKEAAAN